MWSWWVLIDRFEGKPEGQPKPCWGVTVKKMHPDMVASLTSTDRGLVAMLQSDAGIPPILSGLWIVRTNTGVSFFGVVFFVVVQGNPKGHFGGSPKKHHTHTHIARRVFALRSPLGNQPQKARLGCSGCPAREIQVGGNCKFFFRVGLNSGRTSEKMCFFSSFSVSLEKTGQTRGTSPKNRHGRDGKGGIHRVDLVSPRSLAGGQGSRRLVPEPRASQRAPPSPSLSPPSHTHSDSLRLRVRRKEQNKSRKKKKNKSEQRTRSHGIDWPHAKKKQQPKSHQPGFQPHSLMGGSLSHGCLVPCNVPSSERFLFGKRVHLG